MNEKIDELPAHCCGRCRHAAFGPYPGVQSSVLVCRYDPPRFMLNLGAPTAIAGAPQKMAMVHVQPIVLPAGYCSHWARHGAVDNPDR